MIIGFDQWHDGLGYDLDALKEMTPSERKSVRVTLHHRSPRDWRDVEALNYLRALGDAEAVEGIKDTLKDSDSTTRLYAAQALHEAGDFPDIDKEVESVLRSVYADSSLVKVLLMAEQHPTPRVKKALLWAVKNGPGRVAVNCAGMLFYHCGLAKEPFDWNHRPFFLRFLPDDKADRAAAFVELCEKMGMDPKDAE